MGLRDLRTDLKSLRYGRDTLGGGTSNQPYIKAKIPDGFNNLQNANSDFILRGGALAVRDSATDILRLGKMFTDTKSPNGLLFIAKQQLLSRIAVRTQTSGRTLNEGVYSPLSTLAQAGVVAFGGHLNKQGINPFDSTGAYSNNDNLYAVRMKNYNNAGNIDESGLLLNRLVSLYTSKIYNTPVGIGAKTVNNIASLSSNILSYPGGPNAPLGIGQTNIRFADQRTGINNVNGKNIVAGTYQTSLKSVDYDPIHPEKSIQQGGLKINLNTKWNSSNYNLPNVSVNSPQNTSLDFVNNTQPQPQGTWVYDQELTLNEDQETVGSARVGKPIVQDFRAKLREKLQGQNKKLATESGATPISPDYKLKNLETRTSIGGINGLGPGNKTGKNLTSYTNGSNIGPIDRINALNLYSSTAVTQDPVKNDLVKFRIAAIDNKKPTVKTFMHFRAFLDNFSDSYNASWNPINYLGRGESFYTYNGFTRTISLGWTVAAQSKEELMPMYRKLNYLASNLAPDYTGKGYMTGNLVQLTIGGYLYEQVGFINSLTYDVPMESPWEIGINDEGNYDNTTKEMPHILKVTGFSFTPIHDFIPSKQGIGVDKGGNVDLFGLQKYIALSTTENTGADDGYSYIAPNTNVVPPQVIQTINTGFPNI
jgi:hypothetical protein